MIRRIGFVAAWVAATFVTGLVAWGAVRLADSQVSEQAVRPLSAAQVEALPLPTPIPTVAVAAETSPTPTQPVAVAVDGVTEGPVAISPPTTVTPEPDAAPAPPASSQPPATAATTPPTTVAATTISPATSSTTTTEVTTTTQAPVASQVKTYQTGGGSVTIVVSPGSVELGGASPAAGFTLKVKKDGPTEVEVEFESTEEEEEEYEFHARWRDGELVVEID